MPVCMRDVCLTETIMNAKNLLDDEYANARIQNRSQRNERATTAATGKGRDSADGICRKIEREREMECADTMGICYFCDCFFLSENIFVESKKTPAHFQ